MTTKITSAIIAKLKTKQEDLKLSDEAFAVKIGVSRPLWALLKIGKREPGTKFLKATMRVFPEYSLDVMNYLAEKE